MHKEKDPAVVRQILTVFKKTASKQKLDPSLLIFQLDKKKWTKIVSDIHSVVMALTLHKECMLRFLA